MPISKTKRADYMRRAGLTEQQLRETTGTFTVDAVSAAKSGAPENVLNAAANGVQAMIQTCGIVSAVYNAAVKDADKDAREVLTESQVAEDRALLQTLFADEYRFTDPRGNVGDKAKTIEVILSGKVRKEGFGKAGFETTRNDFHVHGQGTTAVSIGEFKMKGSGLARNVKTGKTEQRSRTGIYRTTHTYIFRDDRWQLAASQMTRVPGGGPDDLEWEFIDD
ncbi:MAG: nuclear transport factor 2 family protein [Chloroflexi bacterium]|nr:nuclear transport factor 2 family protein [Acidobacteriota bacterium]MCA1587952.1 nuclear transport factor 2 family protein [Chloroflexota bacterium]MCA1719569.1 nuclear transport factor 2 family protein [Actinomycetota bacterium]